MEKDDKKKMGEDKAKMFHGIKKALMKKNKDS